MEKPSTEEVYKQYVKPLSVAERLRLIELTVHDLAVSTPTQERAERPSWMSVRGIAPNLLGGSGYCQVMHSQFDQPKTLCHG